MVATPRGTREPGGGSGAGGPARRARRAARAAAALAVALAMQAAFSAGAFASQASSGELLFYPCNACHPVSVDAAGKPTSWRPIDFEGHGIVLEGHDVLGEGSAACLACHEDQAVDPGMLKTIDGTLVEITGEIALVCQKCHSDKYADWVAGVHGKRKPSCSAQGCHDPHTPGAIYADPLLPFVGNGFQFTVLPERAVFRPLATPAPDPGVYTPDAFVTLVLLGSATAVVLLGALVVGKVKR